jgi:hypothetical protein
MALSSNATRHARQLQKRAHAGQFLMRFARWCHKVQKRLYAPDTVACTLQLLELWSGFHFYNKPRISVVTYVVKQLKQCERKSKQCSDVDVLREWSTSVYRAAKSAADELKQVMQQC